MSKPVEIVCTERRLGPAWASARSWLNYAYDLQKHSRPEVDDIHI